MSCVLETWGLGALVSGEDLGVTVARDLLALCNTGPWARSCHGALVYKARLHAGVRVTFSMTAEPQTLLPADPGSGRSSVTSI